MVVVKTPLMFNCFPTPDSPPCSVGAWDAGGKVNVWILSLALLHISNVSSGLHVGCLRE